MGRLKEALAGGDLFGSRTYPDVPGHVDADTSIEAAKSMEDSAGTLRRIILDFINTRGDVGATCDEAETRFHMRHQTASARIRELVLGGKLIDSGERRLTRSGRRARVYRVRPC